MARYRITRFTIALSTPPMTQPPRTSIPIAKTMFSCNYMLLGEHTHPRYLFPNPSRRISPPPYIGKSGMTLPWDRGTGAHQERGPFSIMPHNVTSAYLANIWRSWSRYKQDIWQTSMTSSGMIEKTKLPDMLLYTPKNNWTYYKKLTQSHLWHPCAGMASRFSVFRN